MKEKIVKWKGKPWGINNSAVITIPSKHVEELKLEEGDELEVTIIKKIKENSSKK